MNRDPFDSLRARNPVPPGTLPDAPMQVASAIAAGRPTLRRGLAIAAATAAVVLVGGGSWLLWSRGGSRETAAPVTSTVASATDSTTPAGPEAEEVPIVVVYFLDDASTLVPVARDLNVLNVRPLPDLGPLTLDLLLFGPGPWDAGPLPDPVAAAEAQLGSAIPAGAELLGLEVADGLAMVDLSAEFATAPPEALAQVVFTATRLEGVQGVRFLIEGDPYWLLEETTTLVPAASAPSDAAVVDPITRASFTSFQPTVMIETPVLGDTLRLPALLTGSITVEEAEVLLQLVAEDGSLLWSGTAEVPCGECPAGAFAAEVPASAAAGTGWATLRAYLSTIDQGPLAEYPVWVVPELPPGQEAEVPEATTTTVPDASPTTIPGHSAPWSGHGLAPDEVPAVALEAWAAAENATECALLFPADADALADGAILHDRYFGGGWGLAWDLPSGPGRWEPGGEYCPDCGREAFGVAGTGGEATGAEDSIWADRLEWTFGPEAGPRYSHAGYGYEGLTSGGAGEPVLAYLFIDHQGCMYNVWSFLGEEHLLALIEQLRFVEGAGGDGLGDLIPFPPDMSAGCAPDTARDLAAFEAALAEGRRTLADLCSVLGVPDWLTGSGLWIPVYDLADGSRLYLGYAGPGADDLIYANLQSPDGTTRDLLGQ